MQKIILLERVYKALPFVLCTIITKESIVKDMKKVSYYVFDSKERKKHQKRHF
jgi:hypothetical protein